MELGKRIVLLLAAAFASTNAAAVATAPVISSGAGAVTTDPSGAYIVDCPTGCVIDLGLNNTANIIVTAGSTVSTPGSMSGSTLTTTAGTLTSGTLNTTGTLTLSGSTTTGGSTSLSGSTIANTGSLNISSSTLTLNYGTLDTTFITNGIPGSLSPSTTGIFAGSIVNDFQPGNLLTSQVGSMFTLIRSGLNSVLFGSHHRTLLDNGMDNTGSGFWASGDYARHHGNSTNASVGEFGFYRDVGSLRLGLGAGANQARQTLALGGSGRLNSRYVLLESDYRSPASGWVGSATAYWGSSTATLARGYMNGVTPELSTGDATGSSWAVRLRGDWGDLATLAGLTVSPYLSYTHAASRLNGYTETGGALPLTYSSMNQISREIRAGVTLLSHLSEQTDLRFPLELTHRENGSATVIVAVNPLFSFPMSNPGNKQNWGRAGIELDHRLDAQTVLNGATILSTLGGDSSWLATISLKHAF
ncbi:MAG: autotransporter outer membrane beta-barrel domain-containing protein [Nitrosomonadales bacterium]|nr:autotransporter outer membrane beta-barrel domain-containing protein [Nitrosomonadales bacterium]